MQRAHPCIFADGNGLRIFFPQICQDQLPLRDYELLDLWPHFVYIFKRV